MKRTISVILTAAMLALAAPAPQALAQTPAVSVTQSSLATLAEQTAQTLVGAYGATSVQYALIKDGEILLSGQAGWADAVTQTPPTNDTLYGTGSISKIFTTIAVMQLVEQGLVDLDQPVVSYIPEFTMKDPRYGDITVRMLLNHSSGLMGSTLNDAFLYGDNDTVNHDEFLRQLANQNLKADPGAYSVYCNDGFALAEILVEKITGKSFTQYLHENITTPLRLTNTFTPQDALPAERMAGYYLPQSGTIALEDTVNMIGTGGIYATAGDLCRLAQVFMDEQGRGAEVLSADAAALTTKPAYNQAFWPEGVDDNLSFGLGWDRTKSSNFAPFAVPIVSKGGDTQLTHGTLMILPENNMAAAVLTSGGSSAYTQFFCEQLLLNAAVKDGDLPVYALESAAQKDLLARAAEIEADPTALYTIPLTMMPETLQAYSGYYGQSTGVMRVDITPDGQLLITVPGAPDYLESYVYAGNDTFTDATGLVKITFVQEDNGETYLKLAGPSYLVGLGLTQTTIYNSQKLKPRAIPAAIDQVWQARNGQSYYLVSEKYSSQLYQGFAPKRTMMLVDGLTGYADVTRIIDANHSRAALQIPGSTGRDLAEYTFTTTNGVEYLTDGVHRYIHEGAITMLPAQANVALVNNGDAQWYRLDPAYKGQIITVQMPPESNFIVYDSAGNTIYNAYLSQSNNTVLPEGGMIVFVGEPKATFGVTIQ